VKGGGTGMSRWWDHCLERLADFWEMLAYIAKTRELTGAERSIAWSVYYSRIFSIAFWLLIPFEVESKSASTRRHEIIECYLFCELAILFGLFCLAGAIPVVSSYLAGYFLAHVFLALLDIIFVGRLEKMRQVISVERSLLLFVVNAAEIVVAFSIFYRAILCYPPFAALITALLVFGTVVPLESNLRNADQQLVNFIVGGEICCDFLFIAVFLGAFIGGLRPKGTDIYWD
jgi:hypothetical protein